MINETEARKNSNICNIKLPEIILPQFTGKHEDWYIFNSEFDNIITQFNEVQKLHYLNSALKDEAKLLIPEDTFDSLLNALKDRFENK